MLFPSIKISGKNIGDVTKDQENSSQLQCFKLNDANLWKEIMSVSTWEMALKVTVLWTDGATALH